MPISSAKIWHSRNYGATCEKSPLDLCQDKLVKTISLVTSFFHLKMPKSGYVMQERS